MTIPYTTPARWPAGIAPSRFAGLIRTDSPGGCDIGLIGLADDLGVRLNGGRPGAREGPRAFREALARYGVADPDGWDWPRVFDAGDIVPAEGETEAALHETHRRVSEAVGAMLDLGLLPVGIGGGHDLTFAFMRPVVARRAARKAIYFDAHLDVRPTAGSGMPFRALVEQCGVRSLDANGVSKFANSREHFEWFRAHGGTTDQHAARRAEDEFCLVDSVVSIDLDCLDSAFAPGVSAPNPCGWSPEHLQRMSWGAGRCRLVHAIDFMELNPAFDQDGRTARVCAALFLAFLGGFARRAGSKPA